MKKQPRLFPLLVAALLASGPLPASALLNMEMGPTGETRVADPAILANNEAALPNVGIATDENVIDISPETSATVVGDAKADVIQTSRVDAKAKLKSGVSSSRASKPKAQKSVEDPRASLENIAAAPSAHLESALGETYDAQSAPEYDVVVVGAGLSGLRAADLMTQAGLKVKVVEARDRVGGRTLSKNVGKGRFDLGGQWIGPHDTELLSVIEEHGLETFPTYNEGKRVLMIDGKPREYSGLIPFPAVNIFSLGLLQLGLMKQDSMRKKVDPASPQSAENALEWDGQTLETWKRQNIHTKEAQTLFDIAVRSIMSTESSDISLLHWLAYLQANGGFDELAEVKNGAQERRFVKGSQEVSLKMAKRLGDRIVLNAPAQAVIEDENGITVRTTKGDFRGKLAVEAIPAALQSTIHHSPSLPAQRAQLIQRIPMGSTIKVLITYDKAFWREKGLSGQLISDESHPLVATWDNTSADGKQPALVGFVVGRQARKWTSLWKKDGTPPEELREAIVAQLVAAFGPEAAEHAEIILQNWSCEDYTRGCYVGSMTPGTWTQFGDELRKPIGRLHIAGTETAAKGMGYMTGALESGKRVAAEAIERLKSM